MKPQCPPRPGALCRAVFRCLFFLICRAAPACAQGDDPLVGDALENLLNANPDASGAEAEFLAGVLEALQTHPLDVNTVRADELLATGLLSPLQAEQLIAYRERLGPLLNLYELQAVPGWERADIRRLLPYITVGNGGIEQSGIPWYKGFAQGRNDLVLRWGRALPAAAEGGADALAFRFRHTFNNRVQYGLTAERDAGEPFFRASNRHGFDFYSAHLFVQNSGKRLPVLAAGDYTARFGQGLLLQTGYVPGKSAENVGALRGGRKLGPYAAFGEHYFLRGLAASFTAGRHWEGTVLVSRRRRDANLIDDGRAFSALQSSGLHRTAAEIADEKSVVEHLVGGSVERRGKHGRLALNGVLLRYDKPWQPAFSPARQFAFSGKALPGFSADYARTFRNLIVYGESALSGNGAPAFVHGILAGLDRNATLALTHRWYRRDYQSVYATPFAEAASAANEHGLYLGLDIRPAKAWRLTAYTDVWRHPWLRPGAAASAGGWEQLVRLVWSPRKGYSLYVLYQTQRKGAAPEQPFSRVRIHMVCRIHTALELRNRVEWTYAGADAKSRGFAAYQEAVFKAPGFPLSGAFRFALFDTENYETRIYTYERDLFSALSIPAFAGRGSRLFLNLSWRINAWLRLEGRLEQTRLERAVTEGSRTGAETAVKLQLRMHLR